MGSTEKPVTVLTVEKVHAEVEKITAGAWDDEAAHAAEDRLHSRVLHAIANGADDPADLAAAALRTADIDFARWCA